MDKREDRRDGGTVRLDDPWYDELASGWGETGDEPPDESVLRRRAGHAPGGGATRAGAVGPGSVRVGVGGGVPRRALEQGRRPLALPAGPSGSARALERSTFAADDPGDAYLAVQRSAAFQEVRDRYRRFVLPASAAFLAWYFGYVIAAITAPGLMATPVSGEVNIAMLAGLGQFATTFLLTWAYARHARLRRDRAALELRWETQELTRGHGRPADRR
ncbi:DUF485 domain-containing protein [Streptomyces sp. URMC 123]|uniref:DUF485 domain-containing protein n=1 Tax=Streptomyces sp. URMC 123 TaxID=3423403 RepID=UPI003F1C2D8C